MSTSTPPLVYGLDQLPFGRTKAYAEIKLQRLKAVKLGSRTVVLAAELQRKPAGGDAGDHARLARYPEEAAGVGMTSHVYHVGALAVDREADPDLDRRARELLHQSNDGRVHLAQRRLGPDKFEYLCLPAAGARPRG